MFVDVSSFKIFLRFNVSSNKKKLVAFNWRGRSTEISNFKLPKNILGKNNELKNNLHCLPHIFETSFTVFSYLQAFLSNTYILLPFYGQWETLAVWV